MKDPTFWMLARASGLLAYAALTAATLLGLLVKARPFRSLSRLRVTDLHRFVALIGLGALSGHGVALVLMAMPMPVPALVIPGLSPYRPVWTAAGVIAGNCCCSSSPRFPCAASSVPRTWRRLHWATYAMFALAAVHGIGSGTDTSRPWVMAFYAGTIGAVTAATVWRALVPPPRRVAKAAPTKHIPDKALEGALHEHLSHRHRPCALQRLRRLRGARPAQASSPAVRIIKRLLQPRSDTRCSTSCSTHLEVAARGDASKRKWLD